MSHIYRLSTVAEGIETAEQAAILRRLGCELGQGHHLCPPQAPAQLMEVVRDWPLRPGPGAARGPAQRPGEALVEPR